ncbi:DUF397 domain-containing protein [Streptomyces bobili]|uniref:DUF397 domain-containing protein n=1 Tax=Streptomyces bobili TaxID=67280 RepID=A0ABZ1R0J4_9ACTN|nr:MULTISPECIES: DUF397 domain-containing protein [Streptomyces]
MRSPTIGYGRKPCNCVEVAPGFTGVVPVRDSKVPHGPVLAFEFGSWAAFIGELKDGSRRG